MLGLRLESRVRFHLVQVRGDSFLAAGTARARAGNQEKASRLGSQVHSSGREIVKEAGGLEKGILERY